MTKRNTAKPVRVVSPIMEEQETSASTLQEWLDKEETVSDLLFSKGKEEGINKSYKSFKNCTFQNQIFSECKFLPTDRCPVRELRPIQYLFCRKLFVPSRIYFL